MDSKITIEDIAQAPKPGWALPGELTFSPDDQWITYLQAQGDSIVRELHAFNTSSHQQHICVPASGDSASEDNLSLETKLRRERARQLELGVIAYTWAPYGERLLVPFPDGLYLQDGINPALRRLVSSDLGVIQDPQFSPDGNWVAYVQANEVWVIPAQGGEAKQITSGAAETGKTHGLAEFIAQEEMHRSRGYWWSPDSQFIAFEEADETHIPVYRIVHQGQEFTGEGAQEDHHYPFAGFPNARVKLGVVSRSGGDPLWMDLGADEDIYLARVNWLPDGQLTAQIENREQTQLDLLSFDPQTGQAHLLLREETPIWINVHDMFYPFQTGPFAGSFLWGSERTGFRHLYLYSREGMLLKSLTNGDWMVEQLAGVDETNGIVYFTATRESPLEAHLYAVRMQTGGGLPEEPKRITQEAGTHQVILDHACRTFIDIHHSLQVPPHIRLCALADGSTLAILFEPQDPRLSRLSLEPPEMVTLQSRDGTTLYGAIYRPTTGSAPYPTIVSIYGGPQVQMVANHWRMTSELRAQYLRQQGYLVFVLDNRGSAHRGLAFEGAIKHHFGQLELQDQIDGIHWLTEQGLTDPQRVGIYGWSHGGYMSAMALTHAPEVFKVAVAGAPVTNFDGYDTHWSEHYMGTPQDNPDGYREGSVMPYVHQMTGKLMLVHGLIDENVHFRHTARLVNALIKARKSYELLLFPDERHMPRHLADRVYMEERILSFLEKEL